VIVDPKPGYFHQHVFNTPPRREGNTVSQTNSLPPITLVIGGARSGKSTYAERLIEESGLKPVYLATATSGDDEMSERIRIHKERRGDVWSTVEEPLALTTAIQEHSNNDSAILVDCLTLWLSNLMTLSRDIEQETKKLASMLSDLNGPVVFVTNEVGLGIVPANELARAFRDHAGRLNQAVAQTSDRVVMMISGLPMTLKPNG
jgi:adenosylcobinamide kinase/adenosylcobinamide-phosphate guanylyltransferase